MIVHAGSRGVGASKHFFPVIILFQSLHKSHQCRQSCRTVFQRFSTTPLTMFLPKESFTSSRASRPSFGRWSGQHAFRQSESSLFPSATLPQRRKCRRILIWTRYGTRYVIKLNGQRPPGQFSTITRRETSWATSCLGVLTIWQSKDSQFGPFVCRPSTSRPETHTGPTIV